MRNAHSPGNPIRNVAEFFHWICLVGIEDHERICADYNIYAYVRRHVEARTPILGAS